MDWIFNVVLPALVSATTGLGGVFLFYRQTAKKKDIENVALTNEEYRKLNDDLSEKNQRLDKKIDELFELLNKTRKVRDSWHDKYTLLEVKNAKLNCLKCLNIKCEKREPPMYEKLDFGNHGTERITE